MARAIRLLRDVLIISAVSLLLLEITLRVVVRYRLLEHRLPIVSLLNRSDFPDGWQVMKSNPLFRRSPDRLLEYEPIPNQERGHIRLNARGFRGPEVAPKPETGTLRIAVLGDSETFGAHLAESETFSAQIEKRLSQQFPGHSVEVLNCGVPGYNTAQEYRYLHKKVLPLAPGIVILRYSFNDPAIEASQQVVDLGWLGTSRVYWAWRLLQRPATPLAQLWADNEGNWPRFFMALHRSPYFQVAASLLEKMASELEAGGIVFCLFVDPEVSGESLHENYPYMEIHQDLATLASGKFMIVDSLDPLREAFSHPRQLWVTPQDPHKNLEVNRIQAWFAVEQLKPIIRQRFFLRNSRVDSRLFH